MPLVSSWFELALAHLIFIRLLRLVKYKDAPAHRALALADVALAFALSGLLTVLASLHVPGALLAASLGAGLVFILWLDAALYRIFTVELGAGGVGGVVLSNLVAEVSQMHVAQRFFLQNRLFTALPLVALMTHLLPLVPALPRLALDLLLQAYLLATFKISPPAHDLQPPGSRSLRPSLIQEFLSPRRPHIPADFHPRPEHAHLLSPASHLPQPSNEHGLLHGTSVIFLTFESLGSAHLTQPGGAVTPFLDSIAGSRTAVSSQRHSCLSPLTNSAHSALYFSRYTDKLRPRKDTPPLRALQSAGYQTLYLTTATVEHYGLARILRTAGFQHIVDGRGLKSEQDHPGPVSDYALLGDGVRRVQALLKSETQRPFFLHVHSANTHIPYRTVDTSRFNRHALGDDRGRFLNSIEETDWIFSELWAALRQLAPSPLLVISSDHGQAFGEHGYWSHGSAVISAELDVPLILHHPRLPHRTLRFSTHFDVLPTLCDLLGVEHAQPGLGTNLLVAGGCEPAHFLWDGAPSRSTSTCLGLLLGDRKYALDLVRDTCVVSDHDDRNGHPLTGDERVYFEALLGRLAQAHGVG